MMRDLVGCIGAVKFIDKQFVRVVLFFESDKCFKSRIHVDNLCSGRIELVCEVVASLVLYSALDD